MAEKEFTGRHAFFLFTGAFAVIIGVNTFLAVSAVRTFPGLEAKNAYVASQHFNERRDAQDSLGWEVTAEAMNGSLILSIEDAQGSPVQVAHLDAVLGRATHVRDDVMPNFAFDGMVYKAPADLDPGNWNIRLKARAQDGTEFTQRVVLHVKG